MKDKETLNESNFYGQVLEEEKKVDTSKPCDPSNPDSVSYTHLTLPTIEP